MIDANFHGFCDAELTHSWKGVACGHQQMWWQMCMTQLAGKMTSLSASWPFDKLACWQDGLLPTDWHHHQPNVLC